MARKVNPWMEHLKKFRAANKGMNNKLIFAAAKKTYKTQGTKHSGGGLNAELFGGKRRSTKRRGRGSKRSAKKRSGGGPNAEFDTMFHGGKRRSTKRGKRGKRGKRSTKRGGTKWLGRQ